MSKYDLEKLVNNVNGQLEAEGLESVNGRLIRHYMSIGSIPKSNMEGKSAYYDQSHINSILELRRAQKNGITAKAFATLSQNDSLNDIRQNALNDLNLMDSISASSSSTYQQNISSIVKSTIDMPFYKKVFPNGELYVSQELQQKWNINDTRKIESILNEVKNRKDIK